MRNEDNVNYSSPAQDHEVSSLKHQNSFSANHPVLATKGSITLQHQAISYKKLMSKNSVLSKFSLKTNGAFCVSSIEELFENDSYMQEQILQEYISYMMDICVNETNVHWVGHSEQELTKFMDVQYTVFNNHRNTPQRQEEANLVLFHVLEKVNLINPAKFEEYLLLYEKGLLGYF